MTRSKNRTDEPQVTPPDPRRRQVLKTGGAFAGSLALGSTLTSVPTATLGSGQSEPHSITLGDKTLSVLSDGVMTLPVNFILPETLIDPAKREEMLSAANLPTKQFSNDCNVTLLETAERKILFDVGAGFNFLPGTGKLVEQLEVHGLTPDMITDVIFTHAHPDHIWGLLDDFDELVFPDANYHMHEAEYDYWMDDNTLANTPEARQAFVVGAQNRLPLITEQLTMFRYGAEVIPGIEAVDSQGHTPGHTSFALHGGSEPVHLIGDALTNHFLSFAHPTQPLGADQDGEKAVATRLKLLERFVADKEMILGYHLPFPGLGRVEKGSDSKFTYVGS